ncbi:FAD-dependent monooxygenase [Agrococcus terreus]|uniref:FAD-dependent monooxygenase n=1 Tax=Agrococcus terreus TaxID=574649 RepID=UPI0038506BF0
MHAIVSGAGVAGLALAGRLARDGWTVEVVERAPSPRTAGYLMDLWGLGYDAAEELGVLAAIERRAESFAELRAVDAAGRVRGRVPIGAIGGAVRGRWLTVLRPQLVEALAESLPEGVRVRYGAQLETVHDDGERVTALLSDGERLEGDVLVGADGIGSRVRRLLWGQDANAVRPIADLLAVAWIGEDPQLAADLGGRVATQVELGRQLLIAPLGATEVSGLAVLRGVPASEARDAIAGMGVLGRRAVRAIRAPYVDRVAQTEVAPWVRGRTVLLGDACGGVSLVAGQGASLALAGAARLAEELAYARHPSDVRAGLDAFERDWRPVVEREQARGRRAAAAFAPATRVELEAQRALWRATAVPGVTQLVARAAGGVTTRA